MAETRTRTGPRKPPLKSEVIRNQANNGGGTNQISPSMLKAADKQTRIGSRGGLKEEIRRKLPAKTTSNKRAAGRDDGSKYDCALIGVAAADPHEFKDEIEISATKLQIIQPTPSLQQPVSPLRSSHPISRTQDIGRANEDSIHYMIPSFTPVSRAGSKRKLTPVDDYRDPTPDHTSDNKLTLDLSDMIVDARRVFGRYFSIDENEIAELMAKWFPGESSNSPIYKYVRRTALAWRRNWQARIIRALKENTYALILKEPIILTMSKDALKLHLSTTYDQEIMRRNILVAISPVVDISKCSEGRIGTLYMTWYVTMSIYILEEIKYKINQQDPNSDEVKARIAAMMFSENVYDTFRDIARDPHFDGITVEDIPFCALKPSSANRGKRPRNKKALRIRDPHFEIIAAPTDDTVNTTITTTTATDSNSVPSTN